MPCPACGLGGKRRRTRLYLPLQDEVSAVRLWLEQKAQVLEIFGPQGLADAVQPIFLRSSWSFLTQAEWQARRFLRHGGASGDASLQRGGGATIRRILNGGLRHAQRSPAGCEGRNRTRHPDT